MDIPATPELLFEQIAEPTLRDVFPTFDQLPVLNQKLLRIIHTEIATGRLSDETFQELTRFLLTVWRSLNRSALLHQDVVIEQSDLLETEWITCAQSLHRMDQYLIGLLTLLEASPQGAGSDAPTHYQLHPPEDG